MKKVSLSSYLYWHMAVNSKHFQTCWALREQGQAYYKTGGLGPKQPFCGSMIEPFLRGISLLKSQF